MLPVLVKVHDMVWHEKSNPVTFRVLPVTCAVMMKLLSANVFCVCIAVLKSEATSENSSILHTCIFHFQIILSK